VPAVADADSSDANASATGGPIMIVSASEAIDRFVVERVPPKRGAFPEPATNSLVASPARRAPRPCARGRPSLGLRFVRGQREMVRPTMAHGERRRIRSRREVAQGSRSGGRVRYPNAALVGDQRVPVLIDPVSPRTARAASL
jgi:hypothetical protein